MHACFSCSAQSKIEALKKKKRVGDCNEFISTLLCQTSKIFVCFVSLLIPGTSKESQDVESSLVTVLLFNDFPSLMILPTPVVHRAVGSR